ncbi:MAG: PAS-domain containing protein [Bdellovibrionales bacterium]|nr:PAS-domain containing protein [Ramlibacter sp.]
MLLEPVVSALDSLGIAACVFNEDDTTLLWNRTFLQFFPEHDGLIHAGEHYSENLRRFYSNRLNGKELDQIDKLVEGGIARHRSQQQPFSFEHRGLVLKVASLPVPRVGRIRIWTADTAYVGHPAPVTGAAPHAGKQTQAASPAGAQLPDQARLLRHLADGIMMLDESGCISWVNEQFHLLYGLPDTATVTGLRFEEVYAMAWRECHDDSALQYERSAATLVNNLRYVGMPFQLPLPDGRWVRVIGQRGPQGMGYYSHVDTTVFNRQRSELQEKTSLLETTLSSISQGIFMVGPDGRLISWNRKIAEMLELPETLLATFPTVAEITHFQRSRGDFGNDSVTFVENHARDYVAAGGQGPIPERYLRKTRTGRVYEVQTQQLANGGMVRTFSDVTDHVQAQDEIRRLNRELEERVRQRTSELAGAHKELESFAHSIAHDLRQPLSSIDGFSALLSGLTPSETSTPAHHYVDRIRAGVRQMSALTDGLLSLAYLSRRKLNWADLDLGDVADEVLKALTAREPLRLVNLNVQRGMRVRAEPVLMCQVMENLLENAWKFTARNPQADISVGSETGEGGETVYVVRDNGVGFDMAYAGKLFGAFQRLHSPTDFPSMGIGLAIVHRIIARHGGRTWAEGVPGQGATFYFTLGSEES